MKIHLKNIIGIAFGAIVLLALYKPGYTYEVSSIDSAFTILQLISLIVCAIVAIKYFRKLFVPEFVLLIVIKTYTLLFTVIMQGSLKDYVYSFVWLICEIYTNIILFKI